jgi:hypothetical protein
MPRTFNDSLEEDLERVFFDTSEFAISLTIMRGLHTTPNVAAIKRNKSYDVIGEEGVATSVLSVDFDIIRTAYMIGGVRVDPRPGDLLIVGTDSHEVLPLNGKECYVPSDSGTVLTIHSKKVA